MSRQPLDRIRSIGRIMQPAVTAAALLLPAAIVMVTLVRPDVLIGSSALQEMRVPRPFVPGWIGLPALMLLAVPTGILAWGLWQLRGVFAEHRLGRVFSREAARRLRRFAAAVLASAVLQPLASAALSALVSWSAGYPALRLGVSSHDLLAMLIGGVMLAVACVIEEGVRLAEENASFV